MKHRVVFAVVLTSSAVVVAFASCTFPDVGFADGAGDGSTSDAPAGDSRSPVGANEDVDPTGTNKDATTVPDGNQRIDAGPDAQCCDCDGDHVKGDGGMCALPSGDCDDLNPFIFAGQGFVASTVWNTDHTPVYDWDCNGVVVKQYNYGLAPCAAQAKLSGCNNYQGGYQGNPGCGEPGHYTISCVADTNALNLNCTEMASDNRPQGCH